MTHVASRLCSVCLSTAMLIAAGHPLSAQEQTDSPIRQSALESAVLESTLVRPELSREHLTPRPPALVPLYVTFGVMQVLDMHSTMRALDRGGREGNPIIGSVAGSPVAMGALKAGATTGIILLSEKVRKRHRVAAIVMMAALNSAYAVVVSRNYSIAR